MLKGGAGVYHENGKYAITKEVGEMDFKYDSVYYYGYTNEDYYFFASYKSNWGIVNRDNKVIVPFEYEYMDKTYYNSRHRGDFCMVQKNGLLGTINMNNEVIIPIQYEAMSGWCEYGPEGHYVSKDGKFGLIEPDGKIVVPAEYDGLSVYSPNYILVRKGKKCGAINSKKEVIIPFEYELIFMDFNYWGIFEEEHQDKFVVKQGGSWSYLDKYGNLIQANLSEKGIYDEYSWVREGYNLEGSPCLIWAK
ncbi:WG repeat-containing protein [Owenweeksia hongkongensis]|uniref:WG repeat-containing protein n=1 Tax=Owenweeksia hongkongensis TaxID=253245 RepID=UPI003A8E9417